MYSGGCIHVYVQFIQPACFYNRYISLHSVGLILDKYNITSRHRVCFSVIGLLSFLCDGVWKETTTIGWIAMKFCSDIFSFQRMKHC